MWLSARRRELAVLLFVIAFSTFAGLREPRYFQAASINSVLLWMPLITVAAVGEMMVIVTRGIDISVGSVLGFSGIAVGLTLSSNPALHPGFALALGFGVGLFLGFVNATLVTWGRIAPLIVTIGTLAAFRGLTFLLSHGRQIDSSMIPDSMTSLANHGPKVGGLTASYLLIIALSVAGVAAVFLGWTQLGRDVFAVGGNPRAAYLRGISERRVNLTVYSMCGGLAGLAGAMYAARFGFVNPGSAGQGFELTVIAAVAIGGVRLNGGSGSVLGVVLGCLLLSCINVGLSVLGIDANWQTLSYGLVILVAVVLDGAANLLQRPV